MRARSFIRQILLLAVLSALAQAQVVVTDDANTSSADPTKNFGKLSTWGQRISTEIFSRPRSFFRSDGH